MAFSDVVLRWWVHENQTAADPSHQMTGAAARRTPKCRVLNNDDHHIATMSMEEVAKTATCGMLVWTQFLEIQTKQTRFESGDERTHNPMRPPPREHTASPVPVAIHIRTRTLLAWICMDFPTHCQQQKHPKGFFITKKDASARHPRQYATPRHDSHAALRRTRQRDSCTHEPRRLRFGSREPSW